MADIEFLTRRFDVAKNDRTNWETMWQQIAERVMPQMADFTSIRSQGEYRTEKMFDATPALAAQRAVAAIASFYWPANQRYQRLTTSDKSLNKVHRVKVYMDALTDALFEARYSPRAAFESNMGEAATQSFVFGTGLMFVDEDIKKQALRYRALHLGNTYICAGEGGMIDTVFRRSAWTLRQIEQRWPGGAAGEAGAALAAAPGR